MVLSDYGFIVLMLLVFLFILLAIVRGVMSKLAIILTIGVVLALVIGYDIWCVNNISKTLKEIDTVSTPEEKKMLLQAMYKYVGAR
jgi:hypothetical protein